MRGGEYFLGRNVRVAGDAVPGCRGAAFPFMAVGEPDRQIGARSGITQRAESLSVQPFGPAAPRGVVLRPRCAGVVIIYARGAADRVGKPCDRDILFVSRKLLL